ncbi:helix-turn-helix domain-containing protein [Bacteroidota bacterium]
MIDTDLQDLVNFPREDLSIEVKQWIKLDDIVVQANIARHICAISNYGGGYIVFGFKDKTLIPLKTPENIDKYNRDTFNSISKKYLTPPVECNSSLVKSSKTQITHIVVWIKGHGKSPICTKRDGPQDEKGRVQGIQKGNHYIRDIGPESIKITKPQQWEKLIRQCLINDSEKLLTEFTRILENRNRIPEINNIEEWHKVFSKDFRTNFHASGDPSWIHGLIENHYILSYKINYDSEKFLDFNQINKILLEVNQEVKELVVTGWSMFFPFNEGDIKPYFNITSIDNKEIETYEAELFSLKPASKTLPDFWRVSINCYVSIARGYREDREKYYCPQDFKKAFLSPHDLVREISEFVKHASCLSKRIENPNSVTFICSWKGLQGRIIQEYRGEDHSNPKISKTYIRTIKKDFSIETIYGNWVKVVNEITNPILRLFDGLTVSEEWIMNNSKNFK